MAAEYDWHPSPNQGSVFKVENRNLGWWIILALTVSVVLHIVLYVVLGSIQRATAQVVDSDNVWQGTKNEQPVIDADKLNKLLNDAIDTTIPEDSPIKPEKRSDLDMVDKSLDEFDAMEKLKDEVIRMAPVKSAQIFSAEAPKVPKQALDIAADSMNLSVAEVLSKDLAEMRNKLIDSSSVVAEAQMVLDLDKADDPSKGVNTDEFFKNAAAKAFGKEADEYIKGYTSLDGLAEGVGGLKAGEQIKAVLPTDILFEYNEFELKESARLAMMKLAFLIQTNPDAKYTIEGHTDSFGGEDFNRQLSKKRANAVRQWLVDRLRINIDNVQIVGIGKDRPLVSIDGTADEQALNRRVEIVVKK